MTSPTINLFHVFFVAPLFLFIWWKKEYTPELVYKLLLVLAIGVAGYHGWSYWQKTRNGGFMANMLG